MITIGDRREALVALHGAQRFVDDIKDASQHDRSLRLSWARSALARWRLISWSTRRWRSRSRRTASSRSLKLPTRPVRVVLEHLAVAQVEMRWPKFCTNEWSCVAISTAVSAAVDAEQQAQDVLGRIGVEISRRLVGEQDRRMVDQRARDGHALLLAAGERLRHLVALVIQADVVQERRHAPLDRKRRRARDAHADGDVVEHGAVLEELVVLEHDADAAPQKRNVAPLHARRDELPDHAPGRWWDTRPCRSCAAACSCPLRSDPP